MIFKAREWLCGFGFATSATEERAVLSHGIKVEVWLFTMGK